MPRRVLELVASNNGLAGKLDRLALALADELLGPDVAVAEKIAGLKALSAYRDRRGGGEVKNAFDGYRAALADGDDDDAA